jgi:hypothetical protein
MPGQKAYDVVSGDNDEDRKPAREDDVEPRQATVSYRACCTFEFFFLDDLK